MDSVKDTRIPKSDAAFPRHEDVQLLAFEFWHQRGAPLGTPETDWFRAEAELKSESAGADPPLTSMAKTIGSALGSVAAIVTAERASSAS